MGKIIVNGNEISKPFAPIKNGEYAGKKIYKIYEILPGNLNRNFLHFASRTMYIGTKDTGIKKKMSDELHFEDVDDTNVSDGIQNKDGFIYMATYGKGLCHFEDEKLTVLNSKTIDGAKLLLTPLDELYVLIPEDLTNDIGAGIYKYENDDYTVINQELTDYEFIYQVQDGTFYVGSKHGLYTLDNGTLSKISSQNMEHGFVSQVNDGTIYVGMGSHGLKKIIDGKIVNYISDNMTDGTVYQFKGSSVLIGSYNKGLSKIVDDKLEEVAWSTSNAKIILREYNDYGFDLSIFFTTPEDKVFFWADDRYYDLREVTHFWDKEVKGITFLKEFINPNK